MLSAICLSLFSNGGILYYTSADSPKGRGVRTPISGVLHRVEAQISLVSALAISGGHLHPNQVGEKFRKLLQKAGLPPIHFHDLRHSAATILLSMGVNVKMIQELLGHTDISITLGVYGHLLPSMQQTVMETWDSVFGDRDDS